MFLDALTGMEQYFPAAGRVAVPPASGIRAPFHRAQLRLPPTFSDSQASGEIPVKPDATTAAFQQEGP